MSGIIGSFGQAVRQRGAWYTPRILTMARTLYLQNHPVRKMFLESSAMAVLGLASGEGIVAILAFGLTLAVSGIETLVRPVTGLKGLVSACGKRDFIDINGSVYKVPIDLAKNSELLLKIKSTGEAIKTKSENLLNCIEWIVDTLEEVSTTNEPPNNWKLKKRFSFLLTAAKKEEKQSRLFRKTLKKLSRMEKFQDKNLLVSALLRLLAEHKGKVAPVDPLAPTVAASASGVPYKDMATGIYSDEKTTLQEKEEQDWVRNFLWYFIKQEAGDFKANAGKALQKGVNNDEAGFKDFLPFLMESLKDIILPGPNTPEYILKMPPLCRLQKGATIVVALLEIQGIEGMLNKEQLEQIGKEILTKRKEEEAKEAAPAFDPPVPPAVEETDTTEKDSTDKDLTEKDPIGPEELDKGELESELLSVIGLPRNNRQLRPVLKDMVDNEYEKADLLISILDELGEDILSESRRAAIGKMLVEIKGEINDIAEEISPPAPEKIPMDSTIENMVFIENRSKKMNWRNINQAYDYFIGQKSLLNADSTGKILGYFMKVIRYYRKNIPASTKFTHWNQLLELCVLLEKENIDGAGELTGTIREKAKELGLVP